MTDQVVKNPLPYDDDTGDLKRDVATSEHNSGSITGNDFEKHDPEYGSYSDHIFANERVAEHWREIYEKAHYEGRHQFDPHLTWGADEEKKLRRKVCCVNLKSCLKLSNKF